MKKLYHVLVMVLFVGLLFNTSITTQAASEKSDGKNMKKVLSYYKKGNYKKANQYCKKLNPYAKEACVKKMSKGMKKAYKKVVKKWPVSWNSKAHLWGYYLTDIDNDKKADLILKVGTCEADVRYMIYQYKKGKAVKVAESGAGHSALCAYPNNKGIVVHWGHMGYESLSVAKLINGKMVSQPIGDRDLNNAQSGTFMKMGCILDEHIDYDSSYNRTLDLSPFK